MSILDVKYAAVAARPTPHKDSTHRHTAFTARIHGKDAVISVNFWATGQRDERCVMGLSSFLIIPSL